MSTNAELALIPEQVFAVLTEAGLVAARAVLGAMFSALVEVGVRHPPRLLLRNY
jgi:hypothetical protein